MAVLLVMVLQQNFTDPRGTGSSEATVSFRHVLRILLQCMLHGLLHGDWIGNEDSTALKGCVAVFVCVACISQQQVL